MSAFTSSSNRSRGSRSYKLSRLGRRTIGMRRRKGSCKHSRHSMELHDHSSRSRTLGRPRQRRLLRRSCQGREGRQSTGQKSLVK